jgi:hypothetical protein
MEAMPRAPALLERDRYVPPVEHHDREHRDRSTVDDDAAATIRRGK